MRYRPLQQLLLSLLLLSAAPASAATFERILALTPHACEMLYAIGASSKIAGAVAYCDYPEQAKALPRIGSYQGIHVEAALRLKPDAAIVMARHVKGVEKLEKMGVTIIVSNPENFEDIFRDMIKLGRLTGHLREAEALVQKERLQLQHIRRKAHSGVRVFYELWPDPLLTVGSVSFINTLIREAGGINIFADLPMENPHVNIESVVRGKPAMIIVPLEKRSIQARKAFWKPWLTDHHVTFAAINPDLLHRPGPRLIDGLELLQRALNRSTTTPVENIE